MDTSLGLSMVERIGHWSLLQFNCDWPATYSTSPCGHMGTPDSQTPPENLPKWKHSPPIHRSVCRHGHRTPIFEVTLWPGSRFPRFLGYDLTPYAPFQNPFGERGGRLTLIGERGGCKGRFAPWPTKRIVCPGIPFQSFLARRAPGYNADPGNES